MYLSAINLRDWKSYTTARFEFPAPQPGRNIVLIGAENGYGKTSLFEAIVLGLFGRDGLPLIARAPFSGAAEDRLATNYRTFLEKALHRNGLANGRTSCSVRLQFNDERDEPIEIQRIWHFSDNGTFRANDEDIQIYEGATRKSIGPTNIQGQDRIDWYRDYIAKTFLPYYLAAFFLFDGEQISAFADREMAAQVRIGIEGLLGIPILKELSDDLRNYARSRRSQNPAASNETVVRLEIERDNLKATLDGRIARVAELQPALTNLTEERERLTREMASLGAGTQAQLQEQLTRLAQYRKQAEDARDRLHEMLSSDFALAMAGKKLRDLVSNRLHRESVRSAWEAGRDQGDKNLDRYIDSLKRGLQIVQPALLDAQYEPICAAARKAWEALWYPPPADCAESYRFSFVTAIDRSKVIDRVHELEQLTGPSIIEVLNTISVNESSAIRLQEEIARTESVGPQLDAKRERLRAVNVQVEGYNREIGFVRNEITGLTSQLGTKNQEIARLGAQLDLAQPALRRATRAEKVAVLIDELVTQAVPSQISAIALAMTDAYRSMSNKKDLIDRIEITDECAVRLLNKNGVDVRDLDLSAGEKQIFTQALIAAVASVSTRGFPMIVDTPLARLDVEHRKGVLNHLMKRNRQVILLSTNTEVVGDYLALVAPHVSKKYRIRFDQMGDFGESTPIDGYFDTELAQ